jgi:hypothetical protein
VGMLRGEAKGGASGPLVEGDNVTPHRHTAPVWYLTVGFLLSSVTVLAVAHAVAEASGTPHLPGPVRQALALGGCVACCLVDLGVVRRRRACSIGPHRQTGKNLLFRYGPRLGPFLWGLDTGLAVTTFRMTTLTWAAIGLSLLGLAPWWVGVAYGVGFSAPLGWAVLVPKWREPEPVRIVRILVRCRWTAQAGALVVLLSSTAALLVAALV